MFRKNYLKATIIPLVLVMIMIMTSCSSGSSGTSSIAASSDSNTSQAQSSSAAEVSSEPVKEEASGNVIVWTYDRALPESSAGFSSLFPNVTLDVQVVPQFDTKLKQALTTGVNIPDVVNIEASTYGFYANSPLMENLSAAPFSADEELGGKLIQFWWDSGKSNAGEMKIIPNAPGMGATYYRRDVAKKAFGTDNPEELEKLLPDLNSILTNAQKVKDATNGEASILFGADFLFQMALGQQGVAFVDVNTMEFDANRLVEPFELALKAVEAGIPATSVNFAEDMKAGKVLMYNDGSWGEAYTIRAITGADDKGVPLQEGQWGVMNTPGGNINKGGNGFSIPVGAKNKTAAWEYIKYMTTNEEVQLNIMKNSGVYPALIAVQSDTFMQEEVSFFAGQKARLKYAECAKNIIITPVTPFDSAVNNIFNKYVGQVLNKEITMEDGIKSICDELSKEVMLKIIPLK